MNLKKTRLRLGKEIYGTKNILQAFQEAFSPYFSQDKTDNAMYTRTIMNSALISGSRTWVRKEMLSNDHSQ